MKMRSRFAITNACLAIIGVTIGVAAWAQSGKPPNPADPAAKAPGVKYESSFSDYQGFRDPSLRSWQEVNKEVADNPAMGTMKHKPGMSMSGMNEKGGGAGKSNEGAAGHDMGAMKDKPSKPMGSMDARAPSASKAKEGHAAHQMGGKDDSPAKDRRADTGSKKKDNHSGHDMGSMKDMPGTSKSGASKQPVAGSKSIEGAPDHHSRDRKVAGEPEKRLGTESASKPAHDRMAMAKPDSRSGGTVPNQNHVIAATGVVQAIDKANGRIKLTHEPVAALGWPRMTLFFRLKDGSLSDEIKEGDKIAFSLEKSESGYVVSGLRKGASEGPAPHTKK